MSSKWFIVDSHNQYIPQEAVQKSRGGPTDLTNTTAPNVAPFVKSMDIEAKLRVMDEAGIDMAVLHMASLNYLGLDFCKAMNNGNARIAREYPGRFIPLAHLPLDGGGSAESIYELERSVYELGLKGVALESYSEKVTLDSEELFPLYEKVSQLQVPIVIHPTFIKFVPGGNLKARILGAATTEWENTRACIEVMFGVFNRFPELKFLMPHHGGALPTWQGRMMAQFVPEDFKMPENLKWLPKTPRIRKQLGLDKLFGALFDKLYFDTSGFQGWMPITQATLLTVRPERLCFGTDYGFEMLEAQDIKGFIEDVKKVDIGENDRRNILGENIRTLFELKS